MTLQACIQNLLGDEFLEPLLIQIWVYSWKTIRGAFFDHQGFQGFFHLFLTGPVLKEIDDAEMIDLLEALGILMVEGERPQ